MRAIAALVRWPGTFPDAAQRPANGLKTAGLASASVDGVTGVGRRNAWSVGRPPPYAVVRQLGCHVGCRGQLKAVIEGA